jgi:hypothetical protein
MDQSIPTMDLVLAPILQLISNMCEDERGWGASKGEGVRAKGQMHSLLCIYLISFFCDFFSLLVGFHSIFSSMSFLSTYIVYELWISLIRVYLVIE